MATKIDPSELVTFKEFMLTNAIQLDTITQLLIDKGIITHEEFVAKLKQVQTDYMSRKRSMIKRIISGGQTGADRAALDFAIKMDLPHGGWVPKGRLAEDGPIPDRYNLKEMPTKNFPQRTERNVKMPMAH